MLAFIFCLFLALPFFHRSKMPEAHLDGASWLLCLLRVLAYSVKASNTGSPSNSAGRGTSSSQRAVAPVS